MVIRDATAEKRKTCKTKTKTTWQSRIIAKVGSLLVSMNSVLRLIGNTVNETTNQSNWIQCRQLIICVLLKARKKCLRPRNVGFVCPMLRKGWANCSNLSPQTVHRLYCNIVRKYRKESRKACANKLQGTAYRSATLFPILSYRSSRASN